MAAEDPTYAARLREALERDGWSQARLVRDLAAETGNAPESERSAVRGYLRGAIPRPERAKLIAAVTGVPELGEAEHPRLSGSARLERHLELLSAQLRANQEAGLANQQSALETQQELLAELRSLRAAVESLREELPTAPKRSRQTGR